MTAPQSAVLKQSAEKTGNKQTKKTFSLKQTISDLALQHSKCSEPLSAGLHTVNQQMKKQATQT